ncbi:MAG: matrixin family metalloprotease, partial [Ignavibacteriaceae bacterium]|nr:matrixin family metalloprotease [Ignavibacteriaceae bacterium]
MRYVFICLVSFLFWNRLSIIAQYGSCDSPNPCYNIDLSNYTLSGQKWDKNNLKYYFINGTDDIGSDSEKSAFELAFSLWSSFTPLTFEEVFIESEADIKIRFATNAEWATTGAALSGVGASYYPEQDCMGNIILNDGYHNFSLEINPENAKDLYYVALHEVGHVLGLCHSNNSNALMYFDYSPRRTLSEYDIDGIRAIYPQKDITVQNNWNGGDISINEESFTSPKDLLLNENDELNLFAIEQTDNEQYNRIWNNSGQNLSYWSKIDYWDNALFLSQNQQILYVIQKEDTKTKLLAGLRRLYEINIEEEFEINPFTRSYGQFQLVEGNDTNVNLQPSININNQTAYFAGWTDDFTQSTSRTISPDDNQTYTALYKYNNHSNNQNGLNNNNQRKIIRTSNGHLHMVYESMGYIWYEYSTDYGSTWLLGNNNKPIGFDEGKNPSLDDYYGVLSVIYQGKGSGTGSTIKVASISNGVVNDTKLVATLNDTYSSTEIYPVIAFGNDQLFAAIWRGDCADQDFGVSKALNLRTGTISYDYTSNNYQVNVHTDQFYPASGRHIFNTDENSLNPCVEFYNGDDQNPNKLHIVWQQGTSSIKYERLEFTYSNNTLNYSTYALATLSTGSGFTNNYNPSITVLSDNSPVVSWVGYRTLRDERLEKANAGTYEERIVLRRGYSSGSWSSVFNKYDDEVNTPSVSSALMGYALGWSSENGSTNKIVRSDYGNQIFTTTQVGRDVQLSNGSSHNNIRFITLNTSALPYAFYNQPLPTDIPLKTSSLAVANGREGIVTKGEAGFYYLIGDVVLDQTTINFTELTDETTIGNETELNSYLTTEEFTINNNSDLTFSVRFGTVDS